MAWIIGFANDEQIKRIEEAGFKPDIIRAECEDVLRENYPLSEDDSQCLVWIDLDLELVDLLDIGSKVSDSDKEKIQSNHCKYKE